ncbi:helix-turn-helix transcriptional regulator [Bifidobacterium vespertilionis]|nr:helix-turn-helix transcriptional regulator [Bifidobacterium vespertilionis]
MPGDVPTSIAQRVAKRRKEHGMTQADLARKACVSLGSLRRFEQRHEISLNSLVCIAFALQCEQDFDALFAQPPYNTIDDVIKATKAAEKEERQNNN